MTATAVLPLHVAVVAKLKAAGLTVRNEGEAYPAPTLPYHIVGSWAEPAESERYTNQGSREQSVQIKSWAADKVTAMQEYEKVVAALDNQPLTVTGHTVLRRRVSLVGDFKDLTVPPENVGPHVVVSRFGTRTVEL